jgi:acetyl-CoA hydrolase
MDGDHELVTEDPVSPSDREMEVARRVVEFVPDGCTVQVGMGRFATAVLRALADRRNLRIHAGLLSDGIMDLAASGALTNDSGAIVSGGFIGSPQLYAFLDQNPLVMMRRTEYTHDADVMKAAPYFVSINTALELDLSGQSNAESIKGMPVSGSGGALDFMRGASGAGGLAILGLAASSKDRSRSRIVAELNSPVVVTAPRTDVDVVVTEFGAVDLRGMGLRERVVALQAISDPAVPPRTEQ